MHVVEEEPSDDSDDDAGQLSAAPQGVFALLQTLMVGGDGEEPEMVAEPGSDDDLLSELLQGADSMLWSGGDDLQHAITPRLGAEEEAAEEGVNPSYGGLEQQPLDDRGDELYEDNDVQAAECSVQHDQHQQEDPGDAEEQQRGEAQTEGNSEEEEEEEPTDRELLEYMRDFLGVHPTEVQRCFEAFDESGSGVLSLQGFLRAMRQLSIDVDLDLAGQDVGRLLRLLPRDQQGALAYRNLPRSIESVLATMDDVPAVSAEPFAPQTAVASVHPQEPTSPVIGVKDDSLRAELEAIKAQARQAARDAC